MRAFIAAPIGDAVKKRVSSFSQALKVEGVAVVPEKNMHVTLFFLGEIDDKRAGKVASALEKVAQASFRLKFCNAGVFPNPNFIRVVWVGCESAELKRIYDELSPAIREMGYKIEPFHPHLTVARVKSPLAKEAVKAALEKFQSDDFGWSEISKVTLFESRLSPKGPEYAEVFSKTLCAP